MRLHTAVLLMLLWRGWGRLRTALSSDAHPVIAGSSGSFLQRIPWVQEALGTALFSQQYERRVFVTVAFALML